MKLRDIARAVRIVLGGVVIFQLLTFKTQAQDKPFDTYIVKVNVLPLALRSYNVSYETTMSTNWSIGISANWRPKNGFPFQSKVENYYTDNDIRVRDSKVSQYAITPEVRYYFANASNLRGFYFSTFFQFVRYKAETMVDFKASATPPEFLVEGGINTYSLGISLGHQWRFGNAFYLDWQIIAPHFGLNKGHFAGNNINNIPLNEYQQSMIENKPNEFDIPLVKLDIDAQSDYIDVRTKGLWAGTRLGLSIGYRF